MEVKFVKMTVLLLVLILIGGCATERQITPTLSEPPRVGLDLNPPVLGAVFDGRARREPKDAAAHLKSDLSRIYGSSIEWNDYFTKTPPGHVEMRIRLVTLGATFGSRLISNMAFAKAVSSAQVSASGLWATVVGNISSQETIFASSFSGEGWWNGAAWIDLEVEDYRGMKPISFTIPIVSEDKESNVWGYASGDKAARVAWERASVQLTRAMDSILRTLRNEQP